jgi:hypothetical protein
MRRCVAFILVMAMIGCDRGGTSPASAPATQAQTPAKQVPLGPLQCEITAVAPLLPKRATHLAVDPASNIYYLQETDDGGDTLFIIGPGDVSNALPLSAHAILIAMDEEGTGNIQSIAAGADRNIYFFFTGGTNHKTVACFGRFETRTGVIRILARERELADKSGMGASLALARGSVVSAGRTLWLWLRHADAWAMFSLRPSEFPAEGEIALPSPMTLRSADGTLNPTRPELQLAPGPGDLTLLLDPWTAAIWEIDLTGGADVLQSLVGLPQHLSTPAANSQGDIMFFAAPSDPIQPRVEQRVAPVNVETHYPSLLVLRAGNITPVPRDDFHADSSFPLYSMQIEQLLYESGRDTWIGYDSASGQLVRLRLSLKR